MLRHIRTALFATIVAATMVHGSGSTGIHDGTTVAKEGSHWSWMEISSLETENNEIDS
jgi:hypothetical protein